MEVQKCGCCKKEKELNENNFKLNPLNNNFTKVCIPCLEYFEKRRRKNKNRIKCEICNCDVYDFKNKTILIISIFNFIKNTIFAQIKMSII